MRFSAWDWRHLSNRNDVPLVLPSSHDRNVVVVKDCGTEQMHKTRSMHNCAEREVQVNVLDDVRHGRLNSLREDTMHDFGVQINKVAVNHHDEKLGHE